MNWTEGTLARHSRRKGWNPVLARQKEYFAKARAGKKQTIPPQSAFVPSYIQQHTPQASSSSPFQSPAAPPFAPQTKNCHSHVSTTSASNIRHGPEAQTEPLSRRPQVLLQDSTTTQIQDKRQKLLEQSDWTGINLPKLPEVDFKRIRQAYSPRRSRRTPLRAFSSRHKRSQVCSRTRANDENAALHEAKDAGSIRLRIGNHNLRWSQGEGSIRTSHTLQPLSTNRSPSTLASMPSSPPVALDAFQSSSPTSRLGHRDSHLGRRTARQRRKQPSRSDSAAESSVPLVSLLPQHVMQSIEQETVLPESARPRSFRILSRQPATAESVVGSVIADAGRSPQQSENEVQANADWRAFVGKNLDGIDGGGAQHDRQESGAPSCDKDQDQSLPPTSGAALAPKFTSETESHYFDRTSDEPPVSETSSPARHRSKGDSSRADGTSSAERIRVGNVPDGNLTLANKWTQEPEVRAMLSKKQGPQHMMVLLDEHLAATKPPMSPGESNRERSPDEEELWKMFMFDGDVELVNEKARQVAVKKTARQIMAEQEAARSDEVEIASTAPLREDSPASDSSRQPLETFDASTYDSGFDVISSKAGKTVPSLTSNVAERGSPLSGKPDQTPFKVHVPAPFVGRLVGLGARERTSTAQLSTASARHLSRRRWKSGRPQIRAIPAFDEDPIEEGT
ncbi:hypothetical protein LIA77_08215 [Sarocladium implicatum]|nr:hypothetical protein LIA77_08215 [Sarocladium implicatum]